MGIGGRLRTPFLHFALFSVATVINIINATNLRPLADDYCIAAGVADGPWRAFLQTYMSWSGDLVQILSSITTVGLPIYYFPYSVYGLVPVLLCSFMLSFATFILLSRTVGGELSNRVKLLGSYFFVTFLWPTYWTSQQAFDQVPYLSLALKAEEAGNAALQWSTVISQYLLVPLLLFFIYLRATSVSNKRTRIIVFFFLGILLGLSGYALAVSVFLFIVAKHFLNKNKKYGIDLAFSVGILLALTFSLNSAGARSRASSIGIESLGQLDLARFALRFTSELIASTLNFGTITLFVCGFLLASKCTFFRPDVADYFLVNFLKNSLIFLVIYFATIKISEIFSYIAFWHLITFKAILFFVSLSLGLKSGLIARSRQRFYSTNKFAIAATIFVLIAVGLSSYTHSSELKTRAEKWQTGPAGVKGVADIDLENTWVVNCWRDLKKIKSSPDR